MNEFESQLEVAKLYSEKGHFEKTLSILNQISTELLISQSHQSINQYFYLLIRIYIEQAELKKTELIINQLIELSVQQKIKLKAKLISLIGFFNLRTENYSSAMSYFELALNEAINESNIESIFHTLLGKAYLFKKTQQNDLLKFQIEKLDELNEQFSNNNLHAELCNLKALIYFDQKLYDNAEKILELAIEKINFLNNITTSVTLFGTYINCLLKLKKIEKAKIILSIIKKIAITQNHKALIYSLEKELNKHDLSFYQDDCFIINLMNNTIYEKHKGVIHLKNQHTLLTLLRLLIEKQGSTLSKSDIVKQLWQEEYYSTKHDNKIYVTIKRLKTLIEPNEDTTHYIRRNKMGYFFNSSVNFQIIE